MPITTFCLMPLVMRGGILFCLFIARAIGFSAMAFRVPSSSSTRGRTVVLAGMVGVGLSRSCGLQAQHTGSSTPQRAQHDAAGQLVLR
jgi:Kef-type K+ transport system membrane component KefB